MRVRSLIALLLVGVFVAWAILSGGDVAPPPPAGSGGPPEVKSPVAAEVGGSDIASRKQPNRTAPSLDEAAAVSAHGSLRVLVRSPQGEAVAWVPVELTGVDGSDERTTRQLLATGSNGEVVVPRLAIGTWKVRVGLVATETAFVVRDQQTVVTMLLPESHSATVRAVDSAGAPIAGADVLVWLADRYFDAPQWRPGVVVGQTDGRGELALHGLSQRYRNGSWVQARVPGHGASLARMVPSDDSASTQSRDDAVVLTVSRREATATVLVEGVDGQAVANASVALRAVDAPSSSEVGATKATEFIAQVATTNELGVCRFAPLATGRWSLAVNAAGHGAGVLGFTVPDARPVEVRVQLGESAGLRGSVRDPSAQPVAGAEVSLRMLGERLRATTGRDGSFRFDGLAVGSVDWWVSSDGFVSRNGTSEVHSVVASPEPSTLPVVLQPLVPIHGRLLDEAGEPLGGWFVNLHAKLPGWSSDRRQGRTEVDGQFEVLVRSDRAYDLHVRESDGGPLIAPPGFRAVRVADSPLEVVVAAALRPSSFVALRLVDAAGKPALTALRHVRCWRTGQKPSVATRDEATGELRLGPLLAGVCGLHMVRDDGLQFRVPDIELAVGGQRDLGEVAWPDHGTIEVAVQRLAGVPEGDVLVELTGSVGSLHLRIDNKTLQGSIPVLPGVWDMIVYGGGYREQRATCTVVAGQVCLQRAVLRPAVRVRMRVVKPAGEASVRGKLLTPEGTLLFEFELDADQAHDDWAPPLSVGEYRFVAVGASKAKYKASLTVSSLTASSERRKVVLVPVQ